jgi:hypothetical protein
MEGMVLDDLDNWTDQGLREKKQYFEDCIKQHERDIDALKRGIDDIDSEQVRRSYKGGA